MTHAAAICLLTVVALTGTAPSLYAANGSTTPPDLRLEWLDPAEAIEGTAGETVELRYQLRNIGGRDAFAVVVRAHTSLGEPRRPERLQPGPKAGEKADRKLPLALAVGMREICIDVTLQNLSAEEPGDANVKDNRICRPIRVTPAKRPRRDGREP